MMLRAYVDEMRFDRHIEKTYRVNQCLKNKIALSNR